MKPCKIISAIIACLFSLPLFAQNLIVGSDMVDDSAWEIIYYNVSEQPVYEFNDTGATIDISPYRGGALHVTLEDGTAGGQLLLYQRVTCIAGQEYRASALIKVLEYDAPETLGQWFQYYVAVDEPDPEASDFNPSGTKMFNISSWDGDMLSTWEDRNGYMESVMMNSEIETAPYWICPGDAGTEVEVTVGVKFGSSSIAGAFFDLIVDDVCFFPMESVINAGGGMDTEDEDAWNVTWYNDVHMPEYEFGYAEEPLRFGRGGNLYIWQGESTGQLLLWQRLPVVPGETYRATGGIRALDYIGGADGGAWYQMYIDPAEVDETASDYNPGAIKHFNMDGWQENFPEIFDDLWEAAQLGGGVESTPYYTVPDGVDEVTFGIKFGQYWSDYSGTGFELLLDDIYLFPMTEGGMVSSVDAEVETMPEAFVLNQNYPNPFNPATEISFALSRAGYTTLKVYDILGKLVTTLASEPMQAGLHKITFDAGQLSSGVYYYQLQQNDYTAAKKCIVIK